MEERGLTEATNIHTQEDRDDKITKEINVPCLGEIKLEVPWIVYVRSKIAALEIGLLSFDQGSDVYTAVEHFKNCNYYWGCATLLFVMLPTLPTFIEFMKAKIQEIKQGELCWLGETKLIKTKSPFWGLFYLLLAFFSYFCGGIIFVSIFQLGYTLYCMVKMFLKPPGKDGMIATKHQRHAYRGKFLECQLEAAPQCLLQFWILWSYGFNSWTQYVSIVTSVMSLAWGSTNALLLLLHGDRQIPSLTDALIGLVAILPHSLMMVLSYCLVLTYGINITILLSSLLFVVFFILSALFSDDFYTFVFTIFSAFFSPVLFTRNFESMKKPTLELDCQFPSNSRRNDLGQMEKIHRYRFRSQQFYGLNKMITSMLVLCFLIPLAFLVNSGEQEHHHYGVSTFQFRIHHKPENFTNVFDCNNYCQERGNNESCSSSCRNERPTNLTAPSLCTKICENGKTSEDYFQKKKETCQSLQLSSTGLINVLFVILAILAITSFADAVIILSPKFDWSPSYKLLFNISPEADRPTIRSVTMDLSPLAECETCEEKDISSGKNENRTVVQNTLYRLGRVMVGILGYLWVKFTVVGLAITDYKNGDEWWCVLGLACIVMPSIPVALKHLQEMIRDINSSSGKGKVKPFFKLLLITLGYLIGGFIFFSIYRIGYKVYCTWQNIKDPEGKENEMKYRRKEVKLNLTQAVLESAPDGLLTLYRLLQYNGDVSIMWQLLYSVVIRAMSVANVITRTHLIVRDGSLFVHIWKVFFGLLAVLPHILSRWLTYATILVSDIWLGHKMVKIFAIIYFFQASIMGDNFESTVHSFFSAFTSPCMFLKDFEAKNSKKEVNNKKLKTFYCMNKITTSFFLLIFLILCKFRTEYSMENMDEENKVVICQWIQNKTSSATKDTVEFTENIMDKTCSLHLLFPFLITLTIISLVDGILTIRLRNSPSSILLFPKEKATNIGARNFLIKRSDQLSAVENNTDRICSLVKNGINDLQNPNFEDNQRKESAASLLIKVDTEELCSGRLFGLWWPLTSVRVVPSVRWNDKISYEERGPVTGMRIWRTTNAVFGIQFKYGQIWEEERGHKFNIPNCFFFVCCHLSIKNRLEMMEITLEDGEFINYVETKTNKSTGRLIRLRMKTTKDKTYDSRLIRCPISNLLTAWDVEHWPHNQGFEIEDDSSLVLAYCSGLDEEGHGVGRISNFHWVPQHDASFPEVNKRSSTGDIQISKKIMNTEGFPA